ECSIKVPSNITKRTFDNTKVISIAVAHGLNTARKLGDTPPNICNPTFLANESKKLEKLHKSLKVEILDEKQMKILKMGSLLSVSQGSLQPAKLVIIKYMPIKNKQPIVLVGKGITFDTGGISLKPSSSMDEMKYDMSGAGSVVGTMQACAEMNLKNNVIGILACAENMPSGIATRPGDVVESMSGISIEILNTDAEGRLVLCDALTFSKKYKPKYILDMATLTGACLVGLGKYPSGLFSNDSTLTQKIKKSADVTGDRVWELPLYSDYFDELKSNFADIQNIGGQYGGAITAAAFLANFTKDEKWAHLDIAGTAWESGKNKGSTGRPVKLLTDFVMTNK
ncbi:MAG: leucyl aminopeptidase, partial [Gammaproteobacteria bacterium]|nr:leucyl aminopeptidase [Gammaproteobacteria bacterium]